MLKLVVFCLVIACATTAFAGAVATPLLAKVIPSPEAPANTEHAAHVAATIPVFRYAPLAYTAFSGGYVPSPYAGRYVAYSQPLHASNYYISY